MQETTALEPEKKTRAIVKRDKAVDELKMAQYLAPTEWIPNHLRHENPKVQEANVFVAVSLANRMGEAPIVLMQNMQFINGKASFSATYVQNRLIESGLIIGIPDFETTGEGDTLAVTCSVMDKQWEKIRSATVTYAMAKAEGWTERKGSKYKNMAEHMLTLRALTFLVRRYYPSILLGYQTTDELLDIGQPEALPAGKPVQVQVNRADELKAKIQNMPAEELAIVVPSEPVTEVIRSESTGAFGIPPNGNDRTVGGLMVEVNPRSPF
jgi:hypothetical protein